MELEERAHLNDERPSLVFTLIHGTFGSGDTWMTDESPGSFRAQIRMLLGDNFGIEFQPFDWGCRSKYLRWFVDNRELRRQEATASLLNELEHRPLVSAAFRHYLVGHSHGGNIAMRACVSSEARRKVTGVITLATPFLRYSENRIAVLLGLATIVALLFAARDGRVWILVFALLCVVTNARILVAHWSGADSKSDESIKERLAQLALPEKKDFFDGVRSLELLVLRAHSDEVGAAFFTSYTVGKNLRRLGNVLNSLLTHGLRWFFGVTALAVAAYYISIPIDKSDFERIRAQVEQYLLVPGLLAINVILLAIVFFRLWFAPDGTPWVTSIDVEPEFVPWPGVEPKYTKTCQGLRHSMVKQDSPPVIAEWLLGLDDTRPRA